MIWTALYFIFIMVLISLFIARWKPVIRYFLPIGVRVFFSDTNCPEAGFLSSFPFKWGTMVKSFISFFWFLLLDFVSLSFQIFKVKVVFSSSRRRFSSHHNYLRKLPGLIATLVIIFLIPFSASAREQKVLRKNIKLPGGIAHSGLKFDVYYKGTQIETGLPAYRINKYRVGGHHFKPGEKRKKLKLKFKPRQQSRGRGKRKVKRKVTAVSGGFTREITVTNPFLDVLEIEAPQPGRKYSHDNVSINLKLDPQVVSNYEIWAGGRKLSGPFPARNKVERKIKIPPHYFSGPRKRSKSSSSAPKFARISFKLRDASGNSWRSPARKIKLDVDVKVKDNFNPNQASPPPPPDNNVEANKQLEKKPSPDWQLEEEVREQNNKTVIILGYKGGTNVQVLAGSDENNSGAAHWVAGRMGKKLFRTFINPPALSLNDRLKGAEKVLLKLRVARDYPKSTSVKLARLEQDFDTSATWETAGGEIGEILGEVSIDETAEWIEIDLTEPVLSTGAFPTNLILFSEHQPPATFYSTYQRKQKLRPRLVIKY